MFVFNFKKSIIMTVSHNERITSLLTFGVVAYTLNRYFALNEHLDRYPESMHSLVEKVKGAIDNETYEYFTQKKPSPQFKLNFFNRIAHGRTDVYAVEGCPNFVLKASRFSLLDELQLFSQQDLNGATCLASNSEGAVSFDLFSLAGRVSTAYALREIIQRNGLNRIKVPQKYLCSYPNHLLSPFEVPLHHRRVFVIAERCAVDYTKKKTIDELKIMPREDIEDLARQVDIFFRHAGVLDFHPNNFYIKNGTLVLFDTEGMGLLSPFCVSSRLKAARINFRNLIRSFHGFNDERILTNRAQSAIKAINSEEKRRLKQIVFAAAIVLVSCVLFTRMNKEKKDVL